MNTLYYLNVTVHVLAALFWLGGMFFLGLVGAPVLRSVEPATLRAELFSKLGLRFRRVGWTAVAVLIVTGFGNLYFRGLLRRDVWAEPAFWESPMGTALIWKLTAVVTMVTISGVHDFIAGPAAALMRPGSEEALAARRRASLWARVNAIVGVVLVFAAVRLARGG